MANHIRAGAPFHGASALTDPAQVPAGAPVDGSPQTQGLALAGRLEQALSPNVFFDGDQSFALFRNTEPVAFARSELENGLACLGELLADVDRHGQLQDALQRLRQSMQADPVQEAEMLGHGKRWLTELLRMLTAGPPVPHGDRASMSDTLARDLHLADLSPAAALGHALVSLRDAMARSPDAHGIRSLLHARLLSAHIKTLPRAPLAAKELDAQVADLLSGFGFQPQAGRATQPMARQLARASELNAAAKSLQLHQGTQLLLLAHNILGRVKTAYAANWDTDPPAAGVLTERDDRRLDLTLKAFKTSLNLNIARFLQPAGVPAGPSRRWDLDDSNRLSDRLAAELPEFGPSVKDGREPAADAPATARLQDIGSGGTGVFSGGTDGASRRGPSYPRT